jgi:hypothetical protein
MATVRSEATLPFDAQRQADIKKAETDLRNFVQQVTPAFEALDGKKTVTIRSANPQKIPDVPIPIKSLKKLWSKIVFIVTDRVYPPGYGGAFDYKSATSHIRYDTVNGWNAHPGGLPLIALHELLHSTKQGAAVWKKQWKDYRADCKRRGVKDEQGANYWTSPFFSEVEEFCYSGSRELMRALNLPAYQGPDFEHGYDYGDVGR